MVAHLKHGFSFKRFLWTILTLSVIGLLYLDQTSARFVDDECKGIMGNRDLYEHVVRICDDCDNIYRMSNVGPKCKKNCFYNLDFLWCVYATEREGELNKLNRDMSVLRVGRK